MMSVVSDEMTLQVKKRLGTPQLEYGDNVTHETCGYGEVGES